MKPLSPAEEDLLKGRDLEIQTILSHAAARMLTVVAGEPGLGVTSLLQAGAAPALKDAGFIIASFSSWQGKLFARNLRDVVAQAVRDQADPSYATSGEPLDIMLPEIYDRTGKMVAILLDQFEDYFRCQTGSDLAEVFDAELSRAVPIRCGAFVFGIQSQAVPAFERLQDYIPNLRRNRVVLDALTQDDARAAMMAEFNVNGLEVEPEVADALVTANVAARPTGRVHPFFLKTATARLIEAARRLRTQVIPMSLITGRGGVDRIVLESLDGTIAEFGRNHVELLFRWCNILISKDLSRVAVTENALMEYGGRLNRFALTFLPKAVEANILRKIESTDAVRYEIARESQVPILRDWWERYEGAIASRRRARFMMSIWLAVGAIAAGYVLWWFFGR